MRPPLRHAHDGPVGPEDAPAARLEGLPVEAPDPVWREREAHRLSELGMHAAALVHELRQPLFAIKAFAQLAQGQPARQQEALERILAQAETMEALVLGYHDFSRRPSEDLAVFDVGEAIRSARVVLGYRAAAAGVSLTVVEDGAVAVRGSVHAAQQALVNLGQNAIDAVRGRSDGTVTISVERDARYAWILIEDNGPGLDPLIRAHLYEPFRTTKAHGTGLGLAISREVVTAAGGLLRLGEGSPTRWEIGLPLAV